MNLNDILFITTAKADAVTLKVYGSPGRSAANPITIITSLFSSAKNILALIIGCSAVLYLLYSAFQYISAGGDSAKANKAKQGIINAVIGLAIVGATYAIIRVGMSIGMIFDSATSTTF